MISVKIHGRLGNQLFQYAFLYATASKLGVSFYLDESIDSFKVSKYFDVKEKLITRLCRWILHRKGIRLFWAKKRAFYFKYLQRKHHLQLISFDGNKMPTLQLEEIKDQLLFEGFFQSERYFESNKEVIRHLFKIRPKYVKLYQRYVQQINLGKILVTVHIRRGDYLDANWQLPTSYYHEAISKIHHPDNYYVFITDDPAFVVREFSHIQPQYVSSAHEMVDFQFLINANINILSNSSFSWWGAYLNDKDAQTIAPALWLGKIETYPKDVCCRNWELITL